MRFDVTSSSIRNILFIVAFVSSQGACSSETAVSKSGIHVVAGTYGANCRAPRGNATARLGLACNEKDTCTYKVDVMVLGDPAPNCAKDFVAEWTCGASPTVNQAKSVITAENGGDAGYGSLVTLTCSGAK